MKHILLLVTLMTGFQMASAQTDSLENALKTAKGEQKVKVMNELFRAYINTDPVKAIGYTREALSLAVDVKDQKGMAASYNNLGVAYRNQGALDVALDNYMKSLDIYTTLQNGEGIATTKNNIGNIFSLKKDYAQALKYFQESHNGFVALGRQDRIIGSMNNLGNLHSDLHLYDQARTFYTDAWKLSEKTDTPFADPLSNIGNLFYKEGNYQRAVEYYERALEIVRKQDNRISELSLLANIGEVYTKAGQPAPAQRYLNDAMALAIELHASFYLPNILKSMASNYARQGKLKEAYETFLKYDEEREKVYGEESSRKIAQLDVAVELKQKEKEIEALEMEGRLKSLKLRNTQIIITSVVLAIIAVVAIANLFFMGRRLRQAK